MKQEIPDFIIEAKPDDRNVFMGHVEDTDHVRDLERKYETSLVGYSAKWRTVGNTYHVQVWKYGHWEGVYLMKRDDLVIYDKGRE